MEVQLHGFSDASQSAYGGVIYLRTLYTDTSVSVTLLTTKTRVAPLKKLTIPCLELCGALLTARLLKATAVDLEIPDSNFYIWMDSTIVLAWLKSTPSRLKVCVAHRVQEIIRLIPAEKWKHVSTSSNPADLASREVLPKELLSKRLWWDGMTWLSSSPEEWPYLQQAPRTRALPEIRNVFWVAVEPMSSELWCSFSSLKRLVRVLSWCNLSFLAAGMERQIRVLDSLLERLDTTTKLLRLSQREHFSLELSNLANGTPVPSKSHLYSLQPLVGSDGLLRVGG